MPYYNTDCMIVFLELLSKLYTHDMVILVCGGAAYHKANPLIVIETFVSLLSLPILPIEPIWKEISIKSKDRIICLCFFILQILYILVSKLFVEY